MEKEFHEEFVDCYICGAKGTLRVAYKYISLPIEGEAILLSLKCNSCGYRVTDIYPLREDKKTLIKYEVTDIKDLNKLVYLSHSSRLLIPELGLELELRQIDKGFVTTIEGILERFAEKAKHLCLDNPDRNCNEILIQLDKAIKGERRFTLIIEDPHGRSKVIQW